VSMKELRCIIWRGGLVVLLIQCFMAGGLQAEWVKQEIQLQPGWNAVWLEVTPVENAVVTAFQGIPVRSVWRHYVEEASARYVDNSTELKPESERWLTWSPVGAGVEVITTLHKIHGGHCYLIELDAPAPVTWTVIGQPVWRPLRWLNANYSLTGIPVAPDATTTFAQFFSRSSAHGGVDIRRLSPAGQWVSIPATTPIQRNEAYWIYAKGISSFQGNGGVEVDDRGSLDFGNTVVEQVIVLVNNTPTDASFTLSLLPAASLPGTVSGGNIALALWRDGSSGSVGWEPLVGEKQVAVWGNTKKPIRLAIRRKEMLGQGSDIPFQSVLRVTGLQISRQLGLRANGFSDNGATTTKSHAGLWSGHCIIRGVSEPAGDDPTLVQATASEASLRLLVRVSPDGSASLLREAYIFWLDGRVDAEGNVIESGRFLVAGSDAEVAQLQALYGVLGTGRLKGAVVRDGSNVPRRLSSVGFSFTAPQPMDGGFDRDAGVLRADIHVGYDDDLNPYRHRYHPDHDNLASDRTKLPEGRESYYIRREITLTFLGTDPEDLRFSGWGDNVVGGLYTEQITGLHRDPILVSGNFRLTRVVAE
jgi:hypothetical protein